MKPRILVTAANGNTGFPAAKELLELGFPVRAFVRNPDKPKARELKALGAELFVGDIEDIRDVRKALNGVKRAYFAPVPPNLLFQGSTFATAVEEMFMQAGLYDDNPRVREIVWILIAQRAARGLGSLYVHANEMTMEEAGKIHSEWTPRGWMKTERELLIFEQHLYLRQPGYGTSYITGKYLLEETMATYARQKELQGKPFKLRDFFDELSAIGNIPISLGSWQMTGVENQIVTILGKSK